MMYTRVNNLFSSLTRISGRYLYISGLVLLFIPSIINFFERACNYYSDYLFCENYPSDVYKFINFLYILLSFLFIALGYYRIVKNKQINKISPLFIVFVLSLFLCIKPFASTDIYYYKAIANFEIKESLNPYQGGFIKTLDHLYLDTLVKNPAMYSPGWLEINKLLYKLGTLSNNSEYYILIYKGISLLCILLSFFLIRKYFKNDIAIAFILNPVILFEFISNVHLDVFVLLLNIIFILLIKHKKYLLAIFIIFISILFKINSIINLFILVPLVIIYISSNKERLLFLLKTSVFSVLGIGINIVFYKNYFIGAETFKGLKIQSDWSYNTLFERLNFSLINPLYYLEGGKFFGMGFGLYNKFLLVCMVMLILYSLYNNRNILVKKINFFSVVVFYMVLVNYLLPVLGLRAFFPWYLTWSLVFLFFVELNIKSKLLFYNCLIPAIYYSFVFLLGHFNNYLSSPMYSLMVILEYIVIFVIIAKLTKEKLQTKVID